MMIDQTLKVLAEYDDVVFTKQYHVVEDKNISMTFSGTFFRFESLDNCFDQFNLAHPFILWEKEHGEFQVKHRFNRNLSNDGFMLSITEDKTILIDSRTMNGCRFAIELLQRLIVKNKSQLFLPIVKVTHTPSFEVRGVIEGFYGIPWSHEMRKDCLTFLSSKRMNTYMYAPKDDEYQRKLWRELYSKEKLEEFRELLNLSKANHIDFWYMISPGNDLNYLDNTDLSVLKHKLKQMVQLGVTHFGLLMDDIAYELSDDVKKKFKTSAQAHAYLMNVVYDYLVEEIPYVKFVACPTEYDNHYDSPYLEELTILLHQDIPLFWTGPTTLSRHITTEDIKKMSDIYQRQMIIWDNVPVNDFEQDNELIFLSQYSNRSKQLLDNQYNVLGIVLNPMAQWELSKITVGHSAKYMWQTDRANDLAMWHQVLQEYGQTKENGRALDILSKHFTNRHLEPSIPVEWQQLVKQQDIDALTDILKELSQAVETLKKMKNPNFLIEIKPWFERVMLEDQLWQAMISKNNKKAHTLYQELMTKKHRVGSQIPIIYYETYLKKSSGE